MNMLAKVSWYGTSTPSRFSPNSQHGLQSSLHDSEWCIELLVNGICLYFVG